MFSFARIGATLGMKVEDVFTQNRRLSVRLREKVRVAREIYEKHCGMADVGRMLDHIKASNPSYTQKQLMDVLNAARNFFKHAGESLDDKVEFADGMNDFMLFSACHDCTMLCTPSQPAEVQAYSIWILAVNMPYEDGADDADIERAREAAGELDRLFPGLRVATRAEQKRAGRGLLDEAKRMLQATGGR